MYAAFNLFQPMIVHTGCNRDASILSTHQVAKRVVKDARRSGEDSEEEVSGAGCQRGKARSAARYPHCFGRVS